MIKPAQSVNRVSREGGRIEKKKTIRQHYSMTPTSAEAAAGLFFPPFSFYTILGTCREQGQFIDKDIKDKVIKQCNKQSPPGQPPPTTMVTVSWGLSG